jgi:LmbE family N-acetylglucosaminyl deacetylase
MWRKRAVLVLWAGVALAQPPDVNNPWPKDPYEANNRAPDERLKADLLVVVAHPDDEIMAAAYIAREVDLGKRVAIVWTTRGDGGTNDVGPEQASAMGDIREVEAFRAASHLGIVNMWNLGGPDTPTQNPLESLETCNHGRCLDRLVRIVRLTRPSVILTWLPLGVTGENHGDHQAAGVLATEAFDLAGDPTVFPEQVAPAVEPKQNSNRLEGLRPWQAQKIYYFSNPTHREFFTGQGPEYRATEISPQRHVSYGQIAGEEFIYHRTQGGGKVEQAFLKGGPESLERPIPLSKPTQFLLGKSLVKAGIIDDVFAGIVPGGIPYQRSPGFTPAVPVAPVLELGGVWNFYREFWQAHGLEQLSRLVPAELSVQVGGTLTIPLIIENPSEAAINVNLAAQAPAGWKLIDPAASVSVEPHGRYLLRVRASAPATKRAGWQEFQVSGESRGQSLGRISVRVELADWALRQ